MLGHMQETDKRRLVMKNPYSLVFGEKPKEYVSRLLQNDEVVTSFLEDRQKLFMITGVRGSGKTVFMTNIKKYFKEISDWEVVELSTERDMLNALVGKLGSGSKLSGIIEKAGINLSFFGFGVAIKGHSQIIDIEVALQRILETMRKHKKRLLVLVDEVVDNEYVRAFSSVFQILIRDELPVCLLMTGLYENIDDLQNEKNLTFLHRAPKLHLEPLSIGTMAASYRKNLKIKQDEAIKLAQITRGYSYAFQVLGYCMYENGGDLEDARVLLKQYLEEYVYDKIWSEISEKDKRVVNAIANSENGKIQDIREKLDMKSNEFAPYKKRLIKKSIISDEPGYARFTLPLFDEFVIENYYS